MTPRPVGLFLPAGTSRYTVESPSNRRGTGKPQILAAVSPPSTQRSLTLGTKARAISSGDCTAPRIRTPR
ncbi:hypothetical protein ACFPRL_18465 [Pseudoclavibacter helvolus]